MKMVFQVVLDVDPERWAKSSNGDWPESDKRSLNTAVRQDIKNYLRGRIDDCAAFEEAGVEAEVR